MKTADVDTPRANPAGMKTTDADSTGVIYACGRIDVARRGAVIVVIGIWVGRICDGSTVDAAHGDPSGTDPADPNATGPYSAGTNAAGTNAASPKSAGTNATGTKSAGTNATTVESAGTESAAPPSAGLGILCKNEKQAGGCREVQEL